MKYKSALMILTILFSLSGSISAWAEELRPSGALPVMWVNTAGGAEIVSREVYLDGEYFFDANGWEGLASWGSAESPLPLQIRGRGNATWELYDKKPFRLKLDKKADLMGRGKSKHYVLLPHADDYYGYLRNTVGFELSRRAGLAWTPSQLPVELMLNGRYWGLYFLTEQIKVDGNRVNIVEQADGETDPALITGGWLIEFENYPDGTQIEVKDADNPELTTLFVTPHSPEDLSQAQHDYMLSLLTKVERAISSDDPLDTKWERYVDIDTLACFYIVNEIMDNVEAFHGSCWIHKQQGPATRLLFGPVWDFGSAYNRPLEEPDFIYNQKEPRHYASHWIDRISTFDRFSKHVVYHWLRMKAAGALEIDDFVSDFIATIKPAVEADDKRWNTYTSNLRERAGLFMTMYRAKVDWLNARWTDDSGVEAVTTADAEAPLIVTDVLGRVVLTAPAGTVSLPLTPGRLYIVRQGSTARIIVVR